MNGNPLELIQKFTQFKSQMKGKDPRALLNLLVQSGRVSQKDIDNAMEMANKLKTLLR